MQPVTGIAMYSDTHTVYHVVSDENNYGSGPAEFSLQLLLWGDNVQRIILLVKNHQLTIAKTQDNDIVTYNYTQVHKEIHGPKTTLVTKHIRTRLCTHIFSTNKHSLCTGMHIQSKGAG